MLIRIQFSMQFWILFEFVPQIFELNCFWYLTLWHMEEILCLLSIDFVWNWNSLCVYFSIEGIEFGSLKMTFLMVVMVLCIPYIVGLIFCNGVERLIYIVGYIGYLFLCCLWLSLWFFASECWSAGSCGRAAKKEESVVLC